MATLLAGAGAQLHLLARGADALREAAGALDGAATAWPCDVTDAVAVDRTLHAISEIAPVDLLVNNAGVFPLAPVERTSPDRFEQALAANLAAPFRLLHALVPGMRARGTGHVVTIGSVADRRIFAGNGAYSATKFGARALHEVLREELAGSGVRATLVSPAATDTPLWDPLDPDTTPGLPARTAMLRAEDVADAVLWAVTRPPHVNVDELRVARA